MKREDFKGFFDSYFDPVRSYVYYRCGDTDLATDVAQEVFVRVWEKQFNINDSRIKGLLFKMAREMFISKYRRKGLESRYIGSLQFDYEDYPADGELEYREMKERYEEALIKLPVLQREVFLMSRNEGLKYTEIAERLGISVKAVEKRMSAALTFLRKVLEI